MRTLKFALLAFALSSRAAMALSGNVVATDNVKASLIGEPAEIAAAQSFWVALKLDIREGWHTYWRNPGDSGQATTLEWHLPPGFSAGDIQWTSPHRFDIPPLVNYGYSGEALHLVKLTAPADLKPGTTAVLSAKASWLVCSDVCIPEDATLQLTLPVGAKAGAADPKDAGVFAAARAQMPGEEPAPTRAQVSGGRLIITLGKEWGAALSQIQSLAFFPYDEGGIEYAAPQVMTRSKDAVQLAMKVGDRPPAKGAVGGVLLATEKSGNDSLTVPIEVSAKLSAAGAVAASGMTAGSAGEHTSIVVLFLSAILGGLILNLMPCVFPVLSIKAIGLVEQAKKHPSAVRMKGLVFTLGVISSMLCLAAALLALRAGGEQIGWGFQLQSPLFVTLLVYLLLGVGLNLSGVFEVGGGLAGVGDGLTRGDGYRASFFTGVLTTLVATPCTAPFMAFAVGAALTQPTVVALCIFAALGLGLALPYLLLAFAPVLRRALPRPGPWMDTLKQVFAFPIYASSAWLLWVLAQQTSSLGLGAALAGAILVALAAWAYQKSKSSGAVGRAAALTTAVTALVLAVGLPVHFSAGAAGPGVAGPNAKSNDEWQPYDAAEVDKLKAAGRPLLVNFTASWCLTCLVNERNAFADDAVRAVFRDKGVTLMKGDWTNRDPAITRALSSFGRAGVPLYVVYNSVPGSSEPKILPQLLTASVVQDAFAATANRDALK